MASIGTIVTRVYTSRAQLPVPGATVAVTQRAGGGRHTPLALRVTDENGRTRADPRRHTWSCLPVNPQDRVPLRRL